MNRWLAIIFLILFTAFGYAQQRVNKEFQSVKNDYLQFSRKHSHFMHNGHHKLHYLQWGNPKDPTIIWLHGSFNNALEIEPFALSITKLKFNLIAIDYYGHGQTPIPENDFSSSNLVEDIKELMDSLQIQRCIIGGFSRGAYLATLFYDEYPNRVNALLLEEGGISPFLEHFSVLSEEDLKIKLEEEIQNRPNELFIEYNTEEEAYNALKPYGDTLENQLFKNFSSIRFVNNTYVIYKDIDKLFGMDNFDSLNQLMKGTLTSNKFANELMLVPYYDIINAITVPTLLLEASSKNDPFPNHAYYARLSANNKNITHKLFAESDHNIHFEQPQLFIKTITTFLNTLKK